MPCVTRYAELRYEHRGDHWRIIDVNDGLPGSAVGPLYKTKAELLADLDRYAREFGCDGAGTGSPAARLAAAFSYALDRMAKAAVPSYPGDEGTPHAEDYARTCSPDETGECVICQGRALLSELGYQ